MCLTVCREDLPQNIFQKIFGIKPKIKPLIAKKDITCYKYYYITDIPNVVKSPFQSTFHLVGKSQPKVKLGIEYNMFDNSISIEQGYHSYINEEECMYRKGKIGIVKKCIIPKGATYYVGNFVGIMNCYVSNQLIIL